MRPRLSHFEPMKPERPKWHARLSIEMPGELDLYEKTKALQWNATEAVDWDRPVQNFS